MKKVIKKFVEGEEVPKDAEYLCTQYTETIVSKTYWHYFLVTIEK